jgi:hypothetical protein
MAAPKRLYHELFSMPRSYRGIYWLRLYQLQGGRFQALVTEVPGNNGMAVGNGASMIHRAIARQFAIDTKDLDLIAIWPKLRYFGARRIEPASYHVKAEPGWRQISRPKIEAVVGKLPPLPDHAELFRSVLGCGGRARESHREVFEAIPVAKLPPAHYPYQCAHFDRFKEMLGRSEAHARALAAGRRFIDSLAPEDLNACRYHRANWKRIADASAEILAQQPGAEGDVLTEAAAALRMPAKDRRWLVSLFADPIVLSDKRASYINGQHRGCGLRFSGAEMAAVVVDAVTIKHEVAEWTYLGDG